MNGVKGRRSATKERRRSVSASRTSAQPGLARCAPRPSVRGRSFAKSHPHRAVPLMQRSLSFQIGMLEVESILTDMLHVRGGVLAHFRRETGEVLDGDAGVEEARHPGSNREVIRIHTRRRLKVSFGA